MTDLDFDELDKAVNSLMGGVKEKDPGDGSKTLDISATLAPDEKPAYGTLRHVAERIGSEAIDRQEQTVSLGNDTTPSSLPAELSVPPRATPQKAGRFMDVVHPSSDMKRSSPKRPASREGATIEAPTPEPVVVEAEAPVEVSEPAQAEDTTGNLPAPAAPIDTNEGSEIEIVSKTPPALEPLSSPFLADAKVEKRPLGSEAPTTSAPILEPKVEREPALLFDASTSEPETPPVKEDESSVMDTLVEPAKSDEDATIHIPEEYKDELLAVEKNTDAVSATGAKESNQAPEAKPLAVASIPKQYQEKPSSVESKNGAIFDTDTYHKPLAHPAKKTSGWLWVIAIVVIIALGAGAGAIVYFMGL